MKVLYLAVVLVFLGAIWYSGYDYASKKHLPESRFAAVSGSSTTALDTKTGQLCQTKPIDYDALAAAYGGTSAQLPPVDEVQHPTLGRLYFPKTMPYGQRNRIIEEMENTTKGLPPGLMLTSDPNAKYRWKPIAEPQYTDLPPGAKVVSTPDFIPAEEPPKLPFCHALYLNDSAPDTLPANFTEWDKPTPTPSVKYTIEPPPKKP